MTAMSAQEMYDALWEFVVMGKSEGHNRMCEQLRSGLLIMTSTGTGYLIQAADPTQRS